MSSADIWTYRDQSLMGTDPTGYEVEAVDGSIGKVDEATAEIGGSYVVVDIGPWIFGKKVLLPAGVIDRVEHDERKIYVDRTKDEIKAAPEFDEDKVDEAYRGELSGYYGDVRDQGPGGL